MATFNQRDVQELFIGAAATKTTGGIGTLNDGEIGLFTPGGTRLTESNAATEDRFIIVQARDGNVERPNIVSSVINKNDIVSAQRLVYAADTQQTTNIGYNGTSGSIVAANSTLYHVRVNMRQTLTSNHGGMYVKHGFYQSDASATQEEIAQGIALSLINDFSKEPEDLVLVERLCDEAGLALGTGVDDVVFVKGSKYISATDIDDATTNAALAVGDYIRIGTGTTDEVYKIVSIDATNDIAELDMPYQGATATIADTGLERIAAAAAAAAEWGVRLTGQQSRFVVGKLHNNLVRWTTTLENFGTTAFTETVATDGTGTERQIKELEWFVQGNEGDYFRMGEPNLYPIRSLASGNYDLIHITVNQTYKDSIVNGPIRKVYTIALPETAPNYAIAATADDITDVLEVLTPAASGALAVT